MARSSETFPGVHARVLAVVAICLTLGMATSGAVAAAGPPEPVCTISDERVNELSGLASDGQRWYAVNDGGTQIEIFVLDKDCVVRRVITAPRDPYDIEDLALASDGSLWLADTGNNSKQRETVALHRVTTRGEATLYRLTYPDGQHDAEALLMDRSGVPYVVTKTAVGQSEVYRPAGELRSPGPTVLEKVGEVTISATTTTGGPVGGTGTVLITGGAVSADGAVVALRTYTDAYLYPAPDGDVVAALARAPVRVALPDERQGEAIAFEPDGTLLSASEGLGQPVRRIAGAADLARGAEPTAFPGQTTAFPGQTTVFPGQTTVFPGPHVADDEGGTARGSSGTSGLWAATVPALVVALVVATALVGILRALRHRQTPR
ncbi:MAG: hypothetical protein ACRDQW_12520 [Haloechinothrix sp.]